MWKLWMNVIDIVMKSIPSTLTRLKLLGFASLVGLLFMLQNDNHSLIRIQFFLIGRDETSTRMEIMELPSAVHPYFVATQYHPEYISRPLKPSPPYLGLVLAAAGKLQTHFSNSMSSNTTSEDGDNSGTFQNCSISDLVERLKRSRDIFLKREEPISHLNTINS